MKPDRKGYLFIDFNVLKLSVKKVKVPDVFFSIIGCVCLNEIFPLDSMANFCRNVCKQTQSILMKIEQQVDDKMLFISFIPNKLKMIKSIKNIYM